MKCKWHTCDNIISGRRTVFCSDRCSNNFRVDNRRKYLKRELISYKGGKCEKCDFNEHPAALTFHHKDPTQKEFGVSAMGHTRSLEKLKKEVDKCHLLCMNCHQIIHATNDPEWIIIPV